MSSVTKGKQRDLRLDFFRGISLFIILIDHMRGNTLGNWTPGHFGFSDAACIFIFISGYTAALAFGSLYGRTTWLSATARVALRVWQLYIAQIAVCVVVASIPGITRHLFGTDGYASVLKLDYLFIDPIDAIWGLVTLTYVPAYLDILPVYVVMMAMIPLAVMIARVNPRLVIVASAALWAAARVFHWNLPADPDGGPAVVLRPVHLAVPVLHRFQPRHGLAACADAVALARGAGRRRARVLAHAASEPVLREHPRAQGAARSQPGADQQDDARSAGIPALPGRRLSRRAFHARTAALAAPVRAGAVRHRGPAIALGVPRHRACWPISAASPSTCMGTGAAAQALVNFACFTALILVGQLVAWFKAAPWKQPSPAPALPPAHDERAPRLPYGTRSATPD